MSIFKELLSLSASLTILAGALAFSLFLTGAVTAISLLWFHSVIRFVVGF
jgi:hypothetical protein